LAEGGEMRREPRELEPTPTLDAAGVSVKLVKRANDVAKWADYASGAHYTGPLGTFGKVLKGIDVTIKLGSGYYRDEGYGVVVAIDELSEIAKTSAIIDVSAGVVAGLAGQAAAPIAFAAAFGYGYGSETIEPAVGDTLFKNGIGKVQDFSYDMYDRVFREPQREELGRQLREKHQRTKAENATRATIAAQRAEAEQRARASTPAVAESTGPSVAELIQQSLTQIQQFREAKAAAQGGGASPQAASRGCQIPANDPSGRVCTAN
jgi:hypothetical protein